MAYALKKWVQSLLYKVDFLITYILWQEGRKGVENTRPHLELPHVVDVRTGVLVPLQAEVDRGVLHLHVQTADAAAKARHSAVAAAQAPVGPPHPPVGLVGQRADGHDDLGGAVHADGRVVHVARDHRSGGDENLGGGS